MSDSTHRSPVSAPRPRALAWLCLLAGLLAFGCDREEPPVLGDVGSFSLIDENGDRFEPRDIEGKVWIAAFMFTRCPTICPRVTRAMRQVQEEGKARGIDYELVSFSVDPENDTPEVLRKYAHEYGADLSSWTFATGDLSEVTRLAEQGFKTALAVKPNAKEEHFGITHASHLILVDDEMRIRGYYSTSDPEALARIVDDAENLAD